MPRVAVVTGSNRGLGYAIVKGLAKQFDGVIYLTALNEKFGYEALESAKKEVGADGDKIRLHQLDITDKDSITALRDHIKKEHGGLDILINNAGFAYKNDSRVPFAEQAENTLKVNYFGTKQVCDILFPILRPHARVVNICGRLGHLNKFGPEMKTKLVSHNLGAQELDEIMTEFVRLAKEGKHLEKGFPNTSYGVSKAGEIALSFLQDRQLHKDNSREDIIVNACCPGNIATDMSSHTGVLTPDQGSDTPIYLALLPPNVQGPRGQFLGERKVIDWANYEFNWDEFKKAGTSPH